MTRFPPLRTQAEIARDEARAARIAPWVNRAILAAIIAAVVVAWRMM